MTQEDVAEVSRVERRCFSNPWPASAYRRELRNRDQSIFIVLRAIPDTGEGPPGDANGGADHPLARAGDGLWALSRLPLLPFPRRSPAGPERPAIVGFAGMWIIYDEAHVTTIGVDPVYRGRGFGELLLLALVDEARQRGATWLTLEVRVSNHVAQDLYRKYGFVVQGTRRRYYSDNGEDAYIMWSRSLRDPAYRDLIEGLRQALVARLGRALQLPARQPAPWAGASGDSTARGAARDSRKL